MTAARPAGRARRGLAHEPGRPVDGHGRLPRRRAAVGIDLPPPARGRRRAVPRPSCWACSSSASACRWTCAWSSADWRAGRSAGVAAFMAVKAVAHLRRRPAVQGRATREALQRAALFAQGGEFAFVLYAAAARRRRVRRPHRRRPDGHRHPVDGADAADGHAGRPAAARRDPVAGRCRRRRPRRGPARAGADHRLRPLRPGRVPAAAGARRRRLDHRDGRRDDPGRRQFRLQGLLRRRLAAGRAARVGRRRTPRPSWSASTSPRSPTASSSWSRRSSR